MTEAAFLSDAGRADGRLRRLAPDAPEMAAVHRLLVASFAYMDGRIDPPSSLRAMGVAELGALAQAGPAWVIGDPPRACVFAREIGDRLYLGKLAVAATARGQGLARRLIRAAEDEARSRGLRALELKTRVELVENHAAFARLGFVETGRSAHPGHDRPTSLTFTRPVAPLARAEAEA